jgi:hypothetical protein
MLSFRRALILNLILGLNRHLDRVVFSHKMPFRPINHAAYNRHTSIVGGLSGAPLIWGVQPGPG